MGYFFIAVSIFVILCTFFKPAFYWESRKAVRMRKILGDTGTAFFYYAVGVLLMVIGVLEATQIIELK